jgi:transcriptional antiterminator RfaH
MDDAGGWAVLRTQTHNELMAARSVEARGVEAYIPLLSKPHAERPALLFPGYLFARVDAASDDLLRIRSAPGVAYVLPHGGTPTLLAEGVVDLIRKRLADPSAAAVRALRSGDRVTVINGPFRWMEAVFDRRLNAAGRVRILLELAHRTVQLNIEEASLRKA